MIQQAIKNINEANSYLNISIKNVDKVITKPERAEDFITQDVEVFGKYDGIKISLLRTNEEWDDSTWYRTFVVSYKGSIIYSTEFADINNDPEELDATTGVSQFRTIIDYIDNNFRDWKSIPKNTEFFLEFLMNKPTLTRKYTKLRQLIMIGYSPVTSIKIKSGKILTKTDPLIMEGREKYAKILGLNLPELIFKGKMIEFPKGLNDRAKEYYKDYQTSFKGLDAEEYWKLAKNFFAMLPSLYGSSKEEGVVFHLSKPIGNATVLKIVQDDQYDKDLRFKIKQQYKMEVKDEDQYWLKVREAVSEIMSMVNLNRKLPAIMKDVSRIVYKEYKLKFFHSKKTELNVRDDIQFNVRTIVMRQMPGNDGALVIGKFRVFTNGHKKMFDQALKNHDFLVVALVSNKETKPTLELRKKMILSVYPNIEIITTTSGNLFTILGKTTSNINTILAGTDRVKGYEEQMKRNLDVQVEEVRRGEDDESATKVIRNLSDIKYFRKNTPRKIHKFYNELLKTYGVNENFRKQTRRINC